MKTTIETRVRLKLDEIGMKFGTFCEKVGITPVAMRNIFQRNDCKVEDIKKMASALNVSVFYLIGEPESSPQSDLLIDSVRKENDFLKTEIQYLKEIIKLKDSIINGGPHA
jgi:hypothetical protein